MKAVWTFFIILTSISMLLYMGGYLEDTEWSITGTIVNIIGASPGNAGSGGTGLVDADSGGTGGTPLYKQLTILAAALLLAVGANVITGGSSGAGITIVKSTVIIGFMIGFIGDYWNLVQLFKVSSEAGGINLVAFNLIWFLGGLLLIGFIMSFVFFLLDED